MAGVAAAVGDAMYYMLRRCVLYGEKEDPVRKRRCGVYYVFNGATYDGMDAAQVSRIANGCVRAVAKALARRGTRREEESFPERGNAAVRLLIKMEETGLVAKAAKRMHARLKGAGLVEMDIGDYIGMRNGVYDLRGGRFMAKGTVPRGVVGASPPTGRRYASSTERCLLETTTTRTTRVWSGCGGSWGACLSDRGGGGRRGRWPFSWGRTTETTARRRSRTCCMLRSGRTLYR